MPVVTAEESKQLIEDGTYEVELLAIKEAELENASFGDGEVFRWSFQVVGVVDQDGDDIVLDPISNRKLTPLSKFWAWSVALGGKPEIGKSFNTDDLIHKHAMAKVEAKLKPDGTKGFPKVTDLMAMPKGIGRASGNPTGATQSLASAQDAKASAIATLTELRPLLNDEMRALFMGELCARFAEADRNGQFYPLKVSPENAAEFQRVVEEKKQELEEVPFE